MAPEGEKKILDVIRRFDLPFDDKEKMRHFCRILDIIGPDEVDFILRTARVKLRFEDLRTEEKVMKYLTPVIIALVCLAVDRLMLHLLK